MGAGAEASREEGQKTVFEMQGAAEQRDAEMSGGEMWQLTRMASKGFFFFSWCLFGIHTMQDTRTLSLSLVLSHKELGTELSRDLKHQLKWTINGKRWLKKVNLFSVYYQLRQTLDIEKETSMALPLVKIFDKFTLTLCEALAWIHSALLG